jgi:hypothetical protein
MTILPPPTDERDKRASPPFIEQGCQGRPKGARRGSLDGPVIYWSEMDGEARHGFQTVPMWCRVGNVLRSIPQCPVKAGGQPENPSAVHLFAALGGMGRFGRDCVNSIKFAAAPTTRARRPPACEACAAQGPSGESKSSLGQLPAPALDDRRPTGPFLCGICNKPFPG